MIGSTMTTQGERIHLFWTKLGSSDMITLTYGRTTWVNTSSFVTVVNHGEARGHRKPHLNTATNCFRKMARFLFSSVSPATKNKVYSERVWDTEAWGWLAGGLPTDPFSRETRSKRPSRSLTEVLREEHELKLLSRAVCTATVQPHHHLLSLSLSLLPYGHSVRSVLHLRLLEGRDDEMEHHYPLKETISPST